MTDDDALRGHGLEDAVAVEALMGWDDPPPRCATCGAELAGLDRDYEPDGDAGLPICGECNRARNFDHMAEDR